MAHEPQMRDAPEFELIAAVRERLRGPASERHRVGIGDDAAVTVPGGATATTIDAVVDGVHFRSEWCEPLAIGRKAMGAALSDLAAMGAEPGEAYVWLGKPEGLDRAGCLELADGLAEVAGRHGAAILGGDVTAAPAISVAVTAVGHAPTPDRFVGRDGAGVGDAVCVTGELGGAAAGLMALEHPDLRAELAEARREALLARQLRPEPRVAAGMALAAAGATAMIDLSDGLGADASQLAAASDVGLEVQLERVPLADGVRELAAASGRDPFELATAGEDYELLCTLPRAALGGARRDLERTGTPLAEIGEVVAGAATRLRLPGGRSLALGGYDQLGR